MQFAGDLTFLGQGQIKNLVPEVISTPLTAPELASFSFRIWADTTVPALMYWDGTEIHEIAKGGNLEDYLNRDGSMPMTGDLILSGTDQSSALATAAISKGHLDTALALKQDNITGAATTIVDADLAASVAVVSDATGKVVASAVTTAEIDHLTGVTASVQGQIDGKQDDLGFNPVNKAGDNMLGTLNMGGNAIIDLPKAIAPNSPVRLAEFDAAAAGMNWQQDVDGIQVDNTLVVVETEGTRYIVTNVADLPVALSSVVGLEDGDIVEHDGTEFLISFDYSTVERAEGALAYEVTSQEYYRVVGGTWSKFHGLDSLVDGIGLVKSGNVLDVNMGAGISVLPSDEVGIDVKADGGMDIVDPSTGEHSVLTDAQLAIKIEKGVETTALGLRIASEGVTAQEIATASLGNGLQGGAGVVLSVTQNTGIIVDASGVSLDESHTDTIYARQDGVAFTGVVTVLDAVNATEAVNLQVMQAADTVVSDSVTALETLVGRGTFEYDGTALAADTHDIAHGINCAFPNVTCYNEAGQAFLPQDIEVIDANNIRVTLGLSMKINAVVTGKVDSVA